MFDGCGSSTPYQADTTVSRQFAPTREAVGHSRYKCLIAVTSVIARD